jgi:DNA replication protein DnaC
MDKLKEMKAQTTTLSLIHTRDNIEAILKAAEDTNPTYREFLGNTLSSEISYRQDKAKSKRIKEAGFPYIRKLEDFDVSFQKAITQRQFNQLAELTWIEGLYNLIFVGPPGVGKTHLSIALAYKACEEGYRVSYTTMQSLVQCLRTEEIDRRSKAKMNRIRKSSLLVLDEVGYLPITEMDGNLFFQLVSELQEQTSIIITTNKGFEDWTEFLGDPALATAILDRLTYRCDKILMNGKSYRLENHKSYLNPKEEC